MGFFGKKDDDSVKLYGMKIGPMSQRSQEEINADEHPNWCQHINRRGKRCTDNRMSGFSTCRKHQ